MAAHKWSAGSDQDKKSESQNDKTVDLSALSAEELQAEIERRKAKPAKVEFDPTNPEDVKRALAAIEENDGNDAVRRHQELLEQRRASVRGDEIDIVPGRPDRRALVFPELAAKAVRQYGEEMLISRAYANSDDPAIKMAREQCLAAFLYQAIYKIPVRETLGKNASERLVRVLSSTASAGGYLIPPGYIPELTRDVEKLSQLYPAVRKMPVTQPTGSMPKVSTNASVSWGAENTAMSEGDPAFGETTWAVARLNAYLEMSREVANDTNPDIVQTVRELFSEAIARERDRVIAVGTGSGQPMGLYSASGITTAAVTTLTYTTLQQLKHRIDHRYHSSPSMRWVFNQNVKAHILTLLDNQGLPIFKDAQSAGEFDRIFNIPVSVEAGCPDNFIFCGDLRNYVWFGLVGEMGIETSTEAGDLWKKHQIGIKLWERADGDVALPPTVPMVRSRVLTGITDLT